MLLPIFDGPADAREVGKGRSLSRPNRNGRYFGGLLFCRRNRALKASLALLFKLSGAAPAEWRVVFSIAITGQQDQRITFWRSLHRADRACSVGLREPRSKVELPHVAGLQFPTIRRRAS